MARAWSAQYWREKAKDARERAKLMRTEDAKRTMLEIADGFDKFAESAMELETSVTSPAHN